ncbi:zinc finger BED domain-containing protein 5-like [Macrobrachium rosenbergii]|uniref:zinc finger BED domain-containing protein 5-like n=1 Tax=Macrobrachium rosenbergii TaxID=79674 RepID=UPI0034D6B498
MEKFLSKCKRKETESEPHSSKCGESSKHTKTRKIARCKKAHNIPETLVLPAAMDKAEIMLGESSANKLRSIPLADNTVGRRISDSGDLSDQLTDALKYSHFGLQVDEATDVVKDAHLISYVRYISANEIKEDLLFCEPRVGRATAAEVFNMIDNFFSEHGINWDNCVGLCTDGAQSMSGRHARLQALLCKDFGAEHTALLYYCESRWLSRGKVLQRVYEFRNEIATFLCEHKNRDGGLFTDDYFIQKLAYMVDIFEKLNHLNQSMQGPHVNIFTQSDKISAFMKKIELWKRNVENNIFDVSKFTRIS